MSDEQAAHAEEAVSYPRTSLADEAQCEWPPEVNILGVESVSEGSQRPAIKSWSFQFLPSDLRLNHEGEPSSGGTLRPRTSTTLRRRDVDSSKGDAASDVEGRQGDKLSTPEEANIPVDNDTAPTGSSPRLTPSHEDLAAFGAGADVTSDQSDTLITESQAEEGRRYFPRQVLVVMNADGEPKVCCARCDTGAENHIMAECIAKRFGRLDEIVPSEVEELKGLSRHTCTVLGKVKLDKFWLDQTGKPRRGPYKDWFYILSDEDVQGYFDVMLSEKFSEKHRLLQEDHSHDQSSAEANVDSTQQSYANATVDSTQLSSADANVDLTHQSSAEAAADSTHLSGNDTKLGLALRGAVIKIGRTLWSGIAKSYSTAWSLGVSVVTVSVGCCVTPRPRSHNAIATGMFPCLWRALGTES